MGYVDVGAEIAVTGGEQDLLVARLQLAGNRVVRGARSDSALPGPLVALAQATTMVNENGVFGPLTSTLARNASSISGVPFPGLTTVTQIEQFTQALNAFADQRRYATPDTVRLIGPAQSMIDKLLGRGGKDESQKGFPTTKLALAAVGVGALVFFLRRRSA